MMTRIKALTRRDDTIRRFDGVGDNWHMSWAADDKQYVSLCDGFGFSGQSLYLYNARMLTLEGDPENARFKDLPAFPQLAYFPSQKLAHTRYYPFGTLALDGRLYQFMSTFDRPLVPQDTSTFDPANPSPPLRFNGAKLIYSPDNGRSWCNQDGSTPVVWNDWPDRSRNTLVFWEEPQDAFSMNTVLQMGKNYEHNRDGYVYVYAPNGNTEGTMNELVMCRVQKDRLLNRAAYEFFAGFVGKKPQWTPDIHGRERVHVFPRGWVNTQLHPMSWHPSIVFNAPLGVYLMANWGMGTSPEGHWFAKPSYLGFWTAAQPWGPWTQIYEESAWAPGGEQTARAYEPQIAPKWIAADGKSFWLVWTDGQPKGDQEEKSRLSAPLNSKSFDEYTETDWLLKYDLFRRFSPYYSFNTQRVDISL